VETFAFIIHPIDARRDVARKYPLARYLPERVIEWYIARRDPIVAAHITGVRSALGTEAEGWLIGCPLTPRQFLELPLDTVYAKLEQCGHVAEQLGARIIGLGAFSSVVGDAGITLAKRLRIPVTTGNSYTVATAVEGAVRAADLMGIALRDAVVAVVGASGSIGATCAEILARDARAVHLLGRSADRLRVVADRLRPDARARLDTFTDVATGLRDADIVITVSSAAEAIIQAHHIKRGAVVCDVARPRDVSVTVARERNDVLVIEGGAVAVPGDMQCVKPDGRGTFSFGFPPGMAYACMSETMALALEGRYESFTLGKDVSPAQVDTIRAICCRHGFTLSGFRSFERVVTDEEIAAIRARAGRDLAHTGL
jgi:fatty aldehyde-generating acyl-ACP reductase